MHKYIAVMLFTAAICLAEAPPAGVPKGATANPDGSWSYKDKDGKKWVFTNTPFGISRARASDNAEPVGALPANAKLRSDGTYSATDKDGKKWIYTNTPFGLSKRADTGDPVSTAQTKSETSPDVKAIDKGATVRFERKGPMGNSVWEKKKSELSDEERRIYESSKPKPE